MPSSTTAILPVGSMNDWCATSYDSAPHDPFWDLCANTTRGHESDFATVCCDGQIISTEVDIWSTDTTREERESTEFKDMVCCRQAGMNPGGLLPLPQDYTHCASGDPTPLASMAATNTNNAQNFLVTYESASAGTADWTTRSSPSCLWVNTKNVSATTEVTLPAAVITTLPPESGDVWSYGSTSATADIGNATARTTSQVGSISSAKSDSAASNASPAASASSTAEDGASEISSARWPQALLLAALIAAFVALQNG